MTTAAAQIATGSAGFCALVEMAFTDGTVRVTTLPQNIDWNGFTWTGLGHLGSLEQVKATNEADSRSITLSLTVADSTIFSLANGGIETYRGQPCNIYYAVMDSSATSICTDPRLAWFGVMDVVNTSIGGDGVGSIALKCEPHSININRANTSRLNNAQQQAEFTGDLGYQYMEELIGKPTTWLSKKFQRQ